jgi:chemotaxis signal transduction protein
MSITSQMASRAVELRRDFDRGFAAVPGTEETARQELLAIRLADKRFALRLSDIAGLFTDKKITRVPGAKAALLGIAGFRGSIAPVYDLQRLLDNSAADAPRWLVIAAAAPVAFAFSGFDGQLRVSPAAIAAQDARTAQSFTKTFVQTEGLLRPIIELSSVIDAIKS